MTCRSVGANRALARLFGALLIVTGIGACTIAGRPTYTAAPGPFLGPLEPGAIRYVCQEFPFDPSILEVPATDEQADTPFATALRALIEPPEAVLPRSAWHLLGSDADSAEFATGAVEEGLNLVTVLPRDGRLRAQDGGICQPKLVYPAGIGMARWVPDPDAGALRSELTTFVALVTEQSCASGRAAIGRILGPTIAFLDDRVLVAFGVRPQDEGGAFTCQGNPPVRTRVELGQPLGNRVMIDPAVLPVGEFRVPD